MAGERKVAIEIGAAGAAATAGESQPGGPPDEDDDVPELSVRLRRLVPLEGLPAFGRELLERLLPGGRREVTSAELQKLYAKDGFDPTTLVSELLPKPGAASRRPWLSRLLWLASLGGVALQVMSLSSKELMPVALIADLCALLLLRAWPRGYWHGGQPWPAAVALLVPGLLASGAALALLLAVNPPLPLPGFVGTAVAVLAGYAALLAGAWRPWRGEPHATIRELGRIKRYGIRELGRRQPRLEDRFVPHLEALGLGSRLQAWRSASGLGMPADLSGASASLEEGGSTPLARPFTGRPTVPFAGPPHWTHALYVPSAEERETDEEE